MEHRFNESPKYTFMETMKSLFTTAGETLKATMRGEQSFSDDNLYESRLKVCETCPWRETAGIIPVCGICHCQLHLKARTLHAVCPDYRWEDSKKWKPADYVHKQPDI